MITRFVKIQLVIFAIASVVGMTAMIVTYLQLPTLLGIGKITVKMELTAAGGLYRFANVTYRGVQIGEVTSVVLTRTGALANMSIDSSPRISADLVGAVRSVSAVGEQYVDLQPRSDSAPFLHDGSVIAVGNTSIPQPVGPMLDRVSALVGSIPKDKLNVLLDETFHGLNGAGDDLGSLLDSGAALSHDLNSTADQTRSLIDDSAPLLDGQVTLGGRHAHLGAESSRNNRSTRPQRPASPTHPAGGTCSCARGLTSAESGQTDPANAARQLDQPGSGWIDLPTRTRTTVGAAAPVGRLLPGRATDQQPNWPSHRRLPRLHRRSTCMYRGLPTCIAVAFPSRHDRDRYSGWLVLQAAPGFAHRGARRPEHSLHGTPRQARTHR